MKHIMFEGTYWHWDTEKFPRYIVELVFGRHRHDMAMLPVMGGLAPAKDGTLPENGFRVIKTKEKGTILIVPGEDSTNRVLLMAGGESDFRGSIGLDKEATTAKIIAWAYAYNALESGCAFAAIMEHGQRVVLIGDGRDGSFVIQFLFDGESVKKERFTMKEWGFLNSPNNDSEEVL